MSTTRFSLDENIRFIIEDLGREKILEHYTPEERLAGIPTEERLAGLSPEELDRLRKLLNGD